ncbi:hypothetical protein IC582_001962 [Cucumis melo]
MNLEDILTKMVNNNLTFQQTMQDFQKDTLAFQQEKMARTSSSTSQMSQLASTVSKLESKGKLPSQSEVANVSAFTPCTGKVVDTPSSNTTLHKFSNPFLVKKDKVDLHLVAIKVLKCFIQTFLTFR